MGEFGWFKQTEFRGSSTGYAAVAVAATTSIYYIELFRLQWQTISFCDIGLKLMLAIDHFKFRCFVCSVIHNMSARAEYHIGNRLELLLCASEENLEWQEMGCWNSNSTKNRRQRLVNRNTIARFVFCFRVNRCGADDGGGDGDRGGGSSIFMSHSVDHRCCHRTFQ